MGSQSRTASLHDVLARQLRALIARDTVVLQSTTAELLRELSTLRACQSSLSGEERRELRAAMVAMRANAQVLQRASGANARALAALMDPPAVYARSGAGDSGQASRHLTAA